jgi:secondary thiamine-phosphate synthase enzyme
MAPELAARRHHVHGRYPNGIAGPEQSGDVVRFVHVLGQYGQVRLTAFKHLGQFLEPFRRHQFSLQFVKMAKQEISDMLIRKSLNVDTRGRGTYEVTDDVAEIVSDSGVDVGMCHVYVEHTSASLTICENADPDVRTDLETFMAQLIPDGDGVFLHSAEGPDDMPAHIRSVLTQTTLSVPVENGRCALGTWQGLFLWEHRTGPHRRRLSITVQGVS